MTHYRTATEAERVTKAVDSDGEEVLVHTACAERNAETIDAYGGDYTYEDGDTCAVCGNDLAHDAAKLMTMAPMLITHLAWDEGDVTDTFGLFDKTRKTLCGKTVPVRQIDNQRFGCLECERLFAEHTQGMRVLLCHAEEQNFGDPLDRIAMRAAIDRREAIMAGRNGVVQ